MSDTVVMAAIRATLEDREAHVSRELAPHAYASDAMKCRRQVGYRVAGYESTDSFDLHSLIAFRIGNMFHGHVQRAYAAVYEDFQPEVAWSMPGLTGRADGLYTHPQHGLTVLEIKTLAAEKFTAAVEGNVPQAEHMIQADLSAMALGAAWVDIVYVGKGRDKKDKANREPLYRWTYRADLRHAQREYEALAGIVSQVNAGELPEREYEGEVVADPQKKKWPCAWCNYRAQCISDGPGVVPLRSIQRKGA